MKCYQCGEYGHGSSSCKIKEPLCFHCRGVGHVKADCPSSSPVRPTTPAPGRSPTAPAPVPAVAAESSNNNKRTNASMWADEFRSWKRARTNYCSAPTTTPTPVMVEAWQCVHCGGLNKKN